jgi:hypothetical protein
MGALVLKKFHEIASLHALTTQQYDSGHPGNCRLQ